MHILHIQHTELWLLNNQEASNKTWIKVSLRAFVFAAFFPIFLVYYLYIMILLENSRCNWFKKELLDLPDEY